MKLLYFTFLCLLFTTTLFSQKVPLIASYNMEPDAASAGKLIDASGMNSGAKLIDTTFVEREGHGKAVYFDKNSSKIELDDKLMLNNLVTKYTITAWVKIDTLPSTYDLNKGFLFRKGDNNGFQIAITPKAEFFFHGYWGGGWYHGPTSGKMPLGEWAHVALVFNKSDKSKVYLNGKAVLTASTPYQTRPVNDHWKFGNAEWRGGMDDLHIYAAALTDEQVTLDMNNKIETRPATEADIPEITYPVSVSLGRYDMPIPFAHIDGRMKMTAERKTGPNAVDWPEIRVKIPGKPDILLFKDSGKQAIEVSLPINGKEMPLMKQDYDNQIMPTGQWFRAVTWRWGQFYVYSTDSTARTSSGEFELWVFPIIISGEGDADIDSVDLIMDGKSIYKRNEKFKSLTLLLPANINNKKYELSVNGREAVKFDIGLQKVKLGNPKDLPIEVNLIVPGEGKKIFVKNLLTPETFAYQKEYDEALKDMKAKTYPPSFNNNINTTPLKSHINIDTPLSPVSTHLVAMSAGMSGGLLTAANHITRFKGTLTEYADHLANLGVDNLFETTSEDTFNKNNPDYDELSKLLAERNIRLGAMATGYAGWGAMGHPNMAFHSYTLPEWHAPLYREYQLITQRFNRYPNFTGVFTGADNAGYVPYWDWAPPIPNRPWGRSFEAFQQDKKLKTPIGPAISVKKDYEIKGTQKDFINYIDRYDESYKQYGYFNNAVKTINDNLMFTTGSFGSSPGVGGSGGWPWASIPGNTMEDKVSIQTAYDWNEQSSSKPIQNVALIDRLHSYNPDKPTWSIVDDFGLFFGRESLHRAYALALSRGLQGIGGNFLAHTTDIETKDNLKEPGVREKKVNNYKEIFAWAHKCGGPYSMMRPLSKIGILYVHDQAISREIVGGADPGEKLYQGSHEGKTTEALFLCHAAGWPARIITSEELKREQPADIKVILLTGLNRFDNTWVWYSGLEKALTTFKTKGGIIITDDESVSPVESINTGMKIAAYITQSEIDLTPELFKRNEDNISKLQKALEFIDKPIAYSNEKTIWTVPSKAGNCIYITVVNQGFVDGKNASMSVKPQIGNIIWNTERPIYNVRSQKLISKIDAEKCDLTSEGFQLFALPTEEIKVMRAVIKKNPSSYNLNVKINDGKMTGIPLEITVKNDTDKVIFFSASGLNIELPIKDNDPSGDYLVSVKELLSGIADNIKINHVQQKTISSNTDDIIVENQAKAIKAFELNNKPLMFALTAEQMNNVVLMSEVKRLSDFYMLNGRKIDIQEIAPNKAISSLQPTSAIQKYPQWYTPDTDIVLIGTPANNLLIYDQVRGYLLPSKEIKTKSSKIYYTYSPFRGECDALNIIANDNEGIIKAVDFLVR
ncbi:MAG: LamG domain-containing protein [bacterium]